MTGERGGIQWEDLCHWLLVLSIFMALPFDVFCLTLACVQLLLRGKVYVAVKALLLMLLVGSISLLTIGYLGYPFGKFIQQFFLVTAVILLEADFFHFNRDNLPKIFRKYCQFSLCVAVCGLIQMAVLSIADRNIFTFMFRDTGRLTSFTMIEPGRLASVLLPAFVYYLFRGSWKESLLKKIVLFGAIYLTNSFVVLLMMPLVFALRLCYIHGRGFVKWRLAVACVVLAASISSVVTYVQRGDWNLESQRTFYMLKNGAELLDDPSIDSIDQQTLSIYAFSKNFWVAAHSPCRLTGTGLGTHEYNHDSIYFSKNKFHFLNREDGYSLLNRIFSEFGYVGLLLAAWCFIRWYNSRNTINIAVSFLIISYFIRGGHYVANGTIFFIMIYYLTSPKNSASWEASDNSGGKWGNELPDRTT